MEELDLRYYLALLRKWFWLLALGTLLAGGTAYVVCRNMTPVYEATATLLLEQSGSRITSWTLGGSQWEPSTYAALLPKLLPETAARLDMEEIDAENVTIEPLRETRVLVLRVRDVNPQRAADIANTMPLVFAEYTESLLLDRYAESKASLGEELERLETEIEDTQSRLQALGQATTTAPDAERTRLETVLSQHRYNYGQILASYEQVRLAEMEAKGNLVVFRQAAVPQSPVLPRTKQNTLLAAVVGGLLAVGIAFLVEYLDDTLKTPEQVSSVLGLVPLGGIATLPPGHRGEGPKPLVTVSQPRSPTAEAFRVLRTNVQFGSVDRPIGRLLVTSPSPADGKSFLAANLAVAFAQAGRSVVLMDCDLRRPTQHKLFDRSNQVGLTDALLGRDNPDVQQYLQATGVNNLHLLASGPLPPNPAELAGSRRLGELVTYLAEQAEVVILDSPPVLAATDAALLSRQVDGLLLVVHAGRTHEKEARRALEDLSQVDAPILGVALNKIPTSGRGSYGYRYYHYAYEDNGHRKGAGRFLGAFRRATPARQQVSVPGSEGEATHDTQSTPGGE